MEEYLDAVRDIEQRIQRTEGSNASNPLPTVVQPAGVPEEYDDHMTMLFDLLAQLLKITAGYGLWCFKLFK